MAGRHGTEPFDRYANDPLFQSIKAMNRAAAARAAGDEVSARAAEMEASIQHGEMRRRNRKLLGQPGEERSKQEDNG